MDEPAFGEPEGHEGLRPEEADVVAQAGRHDAHAPGGYAEAEALDLPTGGGEPALALVARHAAPDDDELGVEDVHEADTDGGEGAAGALHDGRGVGIAALLGLGHVARLEARRGEGPDQGRESRGLTRGRGRGGQARDGVTGGDALEVARRAAGAGRAVEVDGQVAQLPGRAVGAREEPAAADDGAADA